MDDFLREDAQSEGVRFTEFRSTILSDPGHDDFFAVGPDSDLVAIVLIMEADVLGREAFRQCLRRCIDQVVRKEDFRVFVHLKGYTLSALKQATAEPDSLVGEMLDTLQIADVTAPPDILKQVDAFVRALPALREAIALRRLRNGFSATLGRIARAVEYVSALAVLAAGIWVLRPENLATGWPEWLRSGLGVATGIVYTALTIILLFFVTRLGSWHQVVRERRSHIQMFVPAFFVPWTVGLWERLHVPVAWFIVGVAAGALLDYARRAGSQPAKARIRLGPEQVTPPGKSLPAGLAREAGGRVPDALHCQLFEQQRARVFISYTHSSNWACEQAMKLNQLLQDSKVDVFLDRHVLTDGSNWRAQLNQHLLKANVVIALVDQDSIAKPWPAAELEAALQCRQIDGLPDIILVVNQGTLVDSGTYSVFRCLLAGSKYQTSENRPRIMELEDRTLAVLVKALEPTRYTSTAALPVMLLYLVRLFLGPLELAVVAVGTTGAMFGVAGGLFIVADWHWQWGFVGALSGAWRAGLGLTAAYLLGFVGRLVVASRYEVRAEQALALVRAQLIGGLGLLVSLVFLMHHASPLMVTWAGVVGAFGWIFGFNLLHFSSIGDPEGFRRKPE